MVFIRHGESLWNVVFNRSKFPPFFMFRLVKSAIEEIVLLVQGGRDSLFYDSPLSDVGIKQATDLHHHIRLPTSAAESPRHAYFHKMLRFEVEEKPLLVSSNLRRALTTAALVFQERLRASEDRIVLLPQLQEISVNPDALSIMPPFQSPTLSAIETKTSNGEMLAKFYATRVDPRLNSGNKLAHQPGNFRLQGFVAWLFAQSNSGVIAVGHSLWFLSFFREFLPATVTHPAKNKKLSNGAAVGFTIEKLVLTDKTVVHRIVPDSITLVYGKFK